MCIVLLKISCLDFVVFMYVFISSVLIKPERPAVHLRKELKAQSVLRIKYLWIWSWVLCFTSSLLSLSCWRGLPRCGISRADLRIPLIFPQVTQLRYTQEKESCV